MSQTITLNDRLGQLQSEADSQYQLYRRGHEELWTVLAKAYLWWREASDEGDYLVSLYNARQLQFKRSLNNAPNFNPLIRLIWNFDAPDTTERVTISQWSKAMVALHDHYVQSPADFKHNPTGKLVTFIKRQGGIAGVADATRLEIDDQNQVIKSKKGARYALPPKVEAEIVRRSINQLKKQEKGIAKVSIAAPIRIGGDGLLVMLGRRERNGSVTILGTSNARQQIESVASTAAKRRLDDLPYSLRTLIEIVATQAFPPHALPASWAGRRRWYKRFNDRSEVLASVTEKGGDKPLPSYKQLLVRGNQSDVILSGSRISVSPVTRCSLSNKLIEGQEVVRLRTENRAQIERWIENGEVAVLTSQHEVLQRVPPSEQAAAKYKLPVINSVSAFQKFLHFYEIPQDDKTHYQAEFARGSFKPSWSVQVGQEFFSKLREGWADKWFAELGRYNQILRKHNSALQLRISKTGLTIIFNLVGPKPPSESFSFPSSLTSFGGVQDVCFLSKDLGPILSNLADARIDGKITFAGNSHVLVFNYSTAIGDFEIAIPTLVQGKRDASLFRVIGKKL
jgi:hypothetical protein